jgi:hypothetical protein
VRRKRKQILVISAVTTINHLPRSRPLLRF